MKKILKYTIVYLLSFIIIFFLLDYIAYRILKKDQFYGDLGYKFIRNFNNEFVEPNDTRPPLGTEFQKNPIIFFGCSYAYGSGNKNEETLPGLLSKYTKRPAYNYAHPGQSVQHAILKIQENKINDIIKKSDYAVYIFIGDQLLRTHGIMPFSSREIYPTLKKYKENGEDTLKLYKSKFPFIDYSYLVYYIRRSLIIRRINSQNINSINKLFEKVKFHFEILNKELKKRNPNIQLIVLIYEDTTPYIPICNNKQWKELEAEGIQVVNVKKYLPQIWDRPEDNLYPYCYVSHKYCVHGTNCGDDGHPNADAWKLVADLLYKKLKLIK